jgi:hypothetical protein
VASPSGHTLNRITFRQPNLRACGEMTAPPVARWPAPWQCPPASSSMVCRGTRARVTIDQFRHWALQIFNKHRASSNIFRQVRARPRRLSALSVTHSKSAVRGTTRPRDRPPRRLLARAVVAIAAITNVASALLLEPRILEKIVVVHPRRICQHVGAGVVVNKGAA